MQVKTWASSLRREGKLIQTVGRLKIRREPGEIKPDERAWPAKYQCPHLFRGSRVVTSRSSIENDSVLVQAKTIEYSIALESQIEMGNEFKFLL